MWNCVCITLTGNVWLMLIWMYFNLLIYLSIGSLDELDAQESRLQSRRLSLYVSVSLVLNVVPHGVSRHHWRTAVHPSGLRVSALKWRRLAWRQPRRNPRTEWNCSAVTWMLIINVGHSQVSANQIFAFAPRGGFRVCVASHDRSCQLKGVEQLSEF